MEKDQNIKIKSFTDLNAWKQSHEFVIQIYELTKNFPRDEQFGLTNQIRRAVVSITSNIAEGFSRQYQKEKIQFYSMALGSLTEAQNQLLIARDIKYLNPDNFNEIAAKTVVISKLLNGLIKSIRNNNEN